MEPRLQVRLREQTPREGWGGFEKEMNSMTSLDQIHPRVMSST
jgi:hypothetical protein